MLIEIQKATKKDLIDRLATIQQLIKEIENLAQYDYNYHLYKKSIDPILELSK